MKGLRRFSVDGFTLVEVLVALAVIAVALMASLRAAGQGTQHADELRARMLAGWVAQNHLAEQRARQAWPAPGVRQGSAKQGDIEFTWREEVVNTPNPVFRRVNVFVTLPTGGAALARVTGFVMEPGVVR